MKIQIGLQRCWLDQDERALVLLLPTQKVSLAQHLAYQTLLEYQRELYLPKIRTMNRLKFAESTKAIKCSVCYHEQGSCICKNLFLGREMLVNGVLQTEWFQGNGSAVCGSENFFSNTFSFVAGAQARVTAYPMTYIVSEPLTVHPTGPAFVIQ